MTQPASNFQGELAALLNRYSVGNESNTPDFILARYMELCLEAFDEGVRRRDVWYHGHMMEPGRPQANAPLCGAASEELTCGRTAGHDGKHCDFHTADSPTTWADEERSAPPQEEK